MYKTNKPFFLLALLITSITGCTVYVSPDSATIKRSTIPAADPSYKAPAASPSSTSTTTTTKKTVITEIQDTPVVQTRKQSTATIKSVPSTTIITTQPTQILYTVKPKDTVFSIMRKTNANWSDIIRINSLEPPNYTIYPGQVLRLK